MSLETSNVSIEGMTCSNCVQSITSVLKALPGVEDVEVSLMTESGKITHTDVVTSEMIKEAIEDCGFEAQVIKGLPTDSSEPEFAEVSLKIFGMTCSSCSNSIEQSVKSLDGVKSCNVSLSTEELQISYNTTKIGIRDIVSQIEDCGFECLMDSKMDLNSQLHLLSRAKQVEYWKKTFIQCLVLGAPVVVFGHILPGFMSRHHHHHLHILGPKIIPGIYLDHICEFVLTTYMQFIVGYRFYVSAWKSLKHGSGTMDLLICMSTSILYLYSVFSMIYAICEKSHLVPDVLFPTSAMLFIFISLGKWLENKAKGQTSSLLSNLLSLQPPTCVLVENFNDSLTDLQFKTIPVEFLQVGDVLQVAPGSKISTDGFVIYGQGEVDESLLTGESMPVAKKVGSKLIGGTVNGSNVLYLQVTHIGESTQLQQIVKLVKNAQLIKAPIQRYADVILSIFVPTILILLVTTFLLWCAILWWYYLNNYSYPAYFEHDSFKKILTISISVIVVLCPCALGLLLPTLIMVGTGVGASNGILIKSGEFLEVANKINYVLFDKTGTLTTGDFKIDRLELLKDLFTPEEIWNIIGNIEKNSEHPLLKSLVRQSQPFLTNEVELKEVQFISTMGVTSSIIYKGKSHKVSLGNAGMINHPEVPDLKSTAVHISIDEDYIGFVELSDEIKLELYDTIKYLSRSFQIGMCTGDNEHALQQTLDLLEITDVFLGKNPIEKSSIIEALQADGKSVLFVGDGTNDAPLLIQLDLGILISSGTDVAIESADVVMLDKSITNVINTLDISIKTFQRIKMNFIWAIVYNAIMLPFAMGFFVIPFGVTLNPMILSLSMAFSSVSVVVSSLLLKNWKSPLERKSRPKQNQSILQKIADLVPFWKRHENQEYLELSNLS